MARRPPKFEGSAADEREDARGAKAMGVTRTAYEKTAADRKKDAAGQRKLNARFARKGK